MPPEASEFVLCELMHFYWKISYFRNFQRVYTAPGQPGGGQDFIRGPAPLGPTLATVLVLQNLTLFVTIFIKSEKNINKFSEF